MQGAVKQTVYWYIKSIYPKFITIWTVQPYLKMSAPLLMRVFTTAPWPCLAAMCSAVFFSLSVISTRAPVYACIIAFHVQPDGIM